MSKIVHANHIEFGYELLSALPYAYYLHMQGELDGTISSFDTSPLYYFSPDHTEEDTGRSWDNMEAALHSGVPNVAIHNPYFDFSKFKVPPYKYHYKNTKYKWDKPTVVICNRINEEWGKPPINYFNIRCLRDMFDLLKDKYTIVYINIKGREEYYDNIEPVNIGDFELLKQYPEVINIHDFKDESFNTIQLKIFANCEHFITMNGGHSILASYFGGKNIIYSKQCKELQVGSFWRWYPKIGGSDIYYSDNYEGLLQTIKQVYVDEKPKVNILTRASNRANYIDGLMNSIYFQKYKNVQSILGIEKGAVDTYTYKYNAYSTYYDRIEVDKTLHKNTQNYGAHFPYNLYLNEMAKEVKEGWVIYLDDDDIFINNNALDTITNSITGEDDLILWRVKIGSIIVPSDEHFGCEPVVKDISGIGFMFNSKHLKDVTWTEWRRGDYRVISELYKKLNIVWIDLVLTGTQRESGNGSGKKDDKIILTNNLGMMKCKVINDRFRGKPFQPIGKILELDASTAKSFVQKGLVVILDAPKDEKLFAEDELERAMLTISGQGDIIKSLQEENQNLKAEKILYENKAEKQPYNNKKIKRHATSI